MYCKNCGKEIESQAAFCAYCGMSVASEATNTSGPSCPKCGGTNVDVQVHQENIGGNTITKTKTQYKQKGHGCLWWLCIGWWWWMFDLMLWTFYFPLRFIVQLFKKKKYVGKSTSVSATKNEITYRTVCLCKSCGHHWEK